MVRPPKGTGEQIEHATDDALTPAQVRVLRPIAEKNADKESAEQLSVSGAVDCAEEGKSKHSVQTGRERSHSSRSDWSETRHHRVVICRKSSSFGPFRDLRKKAELT
jgi:hypothetical protein